MVGLLAGQFSWSPESWLMLKFARVCHNERERAKLWGGQRRNRISKFGDGGTEGGLGSVWELGPIQKAKRDYIIRGPLNFSAPWDWAPEFPLPTQPVSTFE